MTSKNRNLLLPFYFGTMKDMDRLTVERELLTDPEVLVDYLDLKRELEAAQEIPHVPPRLWHRLQSRISPRQRLALSLSFGAALVAALLILTLMVLKPKAPTQDILFDSNTELPANSSVL